MMAMRCFTAKVAESGVDPSSLGCWCWFKVGCGNKKTRIVMAYQPSSSRSASSAGTTKREQYEWYFEARGNLHSAHTIFFEQFIAQLIVWKCTDSDIILLGDFNENVHFGHISKRLSQPDLMFSEQCLQCTGIHIPPTFKDGTTPIKAIFAMAGIECANAYILPHRGGLGNHRCFILDFASSSVIGAKFPNIICCSTRKLHCKSSHLVQSYNAKLDMLCNHQKMYQRIHFIYSHLDCLFDNNVLYLMNNWDNKLVQLKLHLEVSCTKFKNCHIKLSPEVGFWLSHGWLLARVKVFVMGLGPPDPHNLIQDYLCAHLFNPRYVSHSNVMIQI